MAENEEKSEQTHVELPPEVQTRIAELENNSNIAIGLLNDPDIQTVLNAKREGKTFKIALTETEGHGSEDAVETDENAEPENENVKAVMAAIEKKLAPMLGDLSMLKGLANSMQTREVNDQIKSVSDQYKDFPKHSKTMASLAKEHPGLSVKDLYVLAKTRSGDFNLEQPSTDSERPTPTPRKERDGTKKEKSHGRNAFNEALVAALEKTVH